MFLRQAVTRIGVTLASAAILLIPAVVQAAENPVREVIDAQIRAAWQREKITPAPRADDAAFLRRVYLDLIGTIPTVEEARKFLDDADAKKREKLIDRLLADPRFAAQQAEVWDLVLFGRNPPGGDTTRRRDSFKAWLTEKFAKNERYDHLVRDLLLAEQQGSEMFYIQFRNQPEDAAVAVSRLFLGTQLQCARCHDHPFESWTQKDFYGMAGFFVRLEVVDGGGPANKKRYFIGEKNSGEVLFSGAAKDQRPGRRGEPIKPKFLGGKVLAEPAAPKKARTERFPSGKKPPPPAFSRKEKLAAWVSTPENPYLARAAANRLWAQFMGRGIVYPVDDLGGKNGPSHPELLAALARELAAHKFDLKWMIRELVNSETYQLASTGTVTAALPPWYERARVRPLSAEEIQDAVQTATGFANTRKAGDRASSKMDPYILRYFGSPTNGQGDFQGSLAEHLFLNNSGQIRQMIQRRKGNLADALLSSTETWDKRVDRLFLAVLTRLPRPEERQRFVAHLTGKDKPEELVEEAIWVLLNCSEFRFNH
jgi:Protein of unknown function (DUF1549)/Protein of unknown function (DUF1553)